MKTAIEIPRFRCRTIRLKHRKDPWGDFELDRAPAFVANPRGILVHRTRYVTGYIRDGKLSHYAVSYLCGNSCGAKPSIIRDLMFADPPEDRLLCSRCHGMAEGMRLPTSDQLAGRHVHRGILVPVQVCCQNLKQK